MKKLIAISAPKFNIITAMRYASSDNFTGKPVYKEARCFLHEDAAIKLQKVIFLSEKIGFRIKIFDAFRPSEAQKKLWKHTPNPEFLANPSSGSPHSRGVAVDLTLVDEMGKELEMGTKFDEFSIKSHHASTDISKKAQKNRFILLGIMTSAGWDSYMNEWWHYQLFDSKKYPLLSDAEARTYMM